jgi:hypothetical protein
VAIVAFALALAGVQASEPAQPRPERQKPLNSLVPRPVEPADTSTVEMEAAAIVVQKFAACVVEKEAKRAAAAIDLPLGTPADYRAAQVKRMNYRMSYCLGRQSGAKMETSLDIMTGAFAEQLYRAKFPSVPALGSVAIPPVDDPDELAGHITRVFADCLIDKAPTLVDGIVRTKASSPEEAAGFASLAVHLGACLDAGSTLKVNRMTLRLALADQLYRRALAGTGTNLAAGKH